MAVSAVVADWSGARYLEGNEQTLEEYMTKERVEANMNTDEYAAEVARDKLGLVKSNETVFEEEK